MPINATHFLARLQRTQFLTPVLVFVMATLTLAFRPPVSARMFQGSGLPARFTATAMCADPLVGSPGGDRAQPGWVMIVGSAT